MQNCWNSILEKWWFEAPFFGTVIFVGHVSLRGLCLTSALIWSRFGVTVFWVLSDLLLYLAYRISFGFLSVCLACFLVGFWPVGCLAVWSGRLSFCCVLFVLVVALYLFVCMFSVLSFWCASVRLCALGTCLIPSEAIFFARMPWHDETENKKHNKHQVYNGWLNSHCPTHCLQKCGDHLYTSSAKCSRRIAPKTSC